MENTELKQALSSKDHIKDPYERVSALIGDALSLMNHKRNNDSELSIAEIDEQIGQKHKLIHQITIENLDEMEEKAKEVRRSWAS